MKQLDKNSNLYESSPATLKKKGYHLVNNTEKERYLKHDFICLDNPMPKDDNTTYQFAKIEGCKLINKELGKNNTNVIWRLK